MICHSDKESHLRANLYHEADPVTHFLPACPQSLQTHGIGKRAQSRLSCASAHFLSRVQVFNFISTQPSSIMKLLFTFLIFMSLMVLVEGQLPGENPCHPPYVKKEEGATQCEQLALPPGFCTSCRISPFNERGEFSDCTRTMDLSNTCIDALQTYVNRNPCDENRARHLDTYLNSSGNQKEDARLRLDWFAFSICEQGCDCIPQIDAERSTPAFDITRGNCQAHAYHHICKLTPNIKLIRLDDGSPDPPTNNLPHVCDHVNSWYGSHHAHNWQTNAQTYVHDDVARFLDGFMRGKQFLELEDFWNQCFDLELAQKRVEEAGE